MLYQLLGLRYLLTTGLKAPQSPLSGLITIVEYRYRMASTTRGGSASSIPVNGLPTFKFIKSGSGGIGTFTESNLDGSFIWRGSALGAYL